MKLSVFIILMCPLWSVAQNSTSIVDAWEPEDSTFRTAVLRPQSIFTDLADDLISFYQKDISSQSVSRCPFFISCSAFCRKAIHQHGLLGIAMFIDRYFYRENSEIYLHYKLLQTHQGTLKLDDELFLFTKTN
jgi:Putative membrane protein insertion efficiency factor